MYTDQDPLLIEYHDNFSLLDNDDVVDIVVLHCQFSGHSSYPPATMEYLDSNM